MKSEMNQLFEDQRSVHVLYAFNGMDKYINQLLDYINDGLAAGDHILLVENERISTVVKKKIDLIYSADQLELVHFVNSMHFYWSSGSYHPPAINEYFVNMVQPYLEKNLSFRSWAHVEWESIKEPLHLIEDFEKIVDEAVTQYEFPLVCAYDKNKMPEYLETILMETHPYVLLKDGLKISSDYKPVKTG